MRKFFNSAFTLGHWPTAIKSDAQHAAGAVFGKQMHQTTSLETIDVNTHPWLYWHFPGDTQSAQLWRSTLSPEQDDDSGG